MPHPVDRLREVLAEFKVGDSLTLVFKDGRELRGDFSGDIDHPILTDQEYDLSMIDRVLIEISTEGPE